MVLKGSDDAVMHRRRHVPRGDLYTNQHKNYRCPYGNDPLLSPCDSPARGCRYVGHALVRRLSPQDKCQTISWHSSCRAFSMIDRYLLILLTVLLFGTVGAFFLLVPILPTLV